MTDVDHPVDGEGWRALFAGLDAAREVLGRRLVSAYALGSLAHGGFSPEASDVDLAVIVDGMEADPASSMNLVRQSVADRLATPLAARLSVFWSSWAELGLERPRGRFPLVDRIDLADTGVCIAGEDRRSELRLPFGEDRRAALVVEGAELMVGKLINSETEALIRDPRRLVAASCREVTKLVLFPVRFLYTLETGRADGNAPAVRWYESRRGVPAARLAAAALEWRSRGLDRSATPRLLEAELGPLYGELISAYALALPKYGRADLAGVLSACALRLGLLGRDRLSP